MLKWQKSFLMVLEAPFSPSSIFSVLGKCYSMKVFFFFLMVFLFKKNLLKNYSIVVYNIVLVSDVQ